MASVAFNQPLCSVLSKNIISVELESVSLNESVRLYLNTGERLLLINLLRRNVKKITNSFTKKKKIIIIDK